ncbi:MAG TPA: PilZ domain-containing protein, partial [bacterium]
TPASRAVFRHEEELQRWRQQYLEVRDYLDEVDLFMTETGDKSTAKPAASGRERRAEPRYPFRDQAQIFAHLGPKAFHIINISIGGVAFFSDVAFEPGTKLLLSALGMIALDVEILSCEMEEVDGGMMEYRYRVRAKFGPRVNGYQVYVLAREMYLQQTQDGDGGEAPEPPKDTPAP